MSEELRAALGKIASGCTVNSTDAANETVKWMQGIASAALRASTDAAAVGDWIGPVPCDGSKPDWLPDDALCMIAYNPRESQNAMTWEFAEKRAKPVRDRDWDGVTAFCFKLVAHPPVADAAVAGEGLRSKLTTALRGSISPIIEWEMLWKDYKPENAGDADLLESRKAKRDYALDSILAIFNTTPDTIGSHYGNGGRFDPGSAPAEPVGLREALAADENGFSDADCMALLLEGYARDVRRKRLVETAKSLERAAWMIRSMSSTLTRTDEASTDGEGEA